MDTDKPNGWGIGQVAAGILACRGAGASSLAERTVASRERAEALKLMEIRVSGPDGKMPPSTAGKMPATAFFIHVQPSPSVVEFFP